MTEHLFEPLGMVDTGFAYTDELLARAAAPHRRLPDESMMAIDQPAPENPEYEAGGGGLHSTMTDYARFMRMILNDGELAGWTKVRSASSTTSNAPCTPLKSIRTSRRGWGCAVGPLHGDVGRLVDAPSTSTLRRTPARRSMSLCTLLPGASRGRPWPPPAKPANNTGKHQG
jgi:CubicO group peptidase (beta-lactamase class C family)